MGLLVIVTNEYFFYNDTCQQLEVLSKIAYYSKLPSTGVTKSYINKWFIQGQDEPVNFI